MVVYFGTRNSNGKFDRLDLFSEQEVAHGHFTRIVEQAVSNPMLWDVRQEAMGDDNWWIFESPKDFPVPHYTFAMVLDAFDVEIAVAGWRHAKSI